jgi:hypothetical protein
VRARPFAVTDLTPVHSIASVEGHACWGTVPAVAKIVRVSVAWRCVSSQDRGRPELGCGESCSRKSWRKFCFGICP